MSITTILFDLDGTLLPMQQEHFVKAYITGLTVAAAPKSYCPTVLSKAILAGTAAMIKNNGEMTNEELFWETLEKLCGKSVRKDMHMFDVFYATDFQKIKDICGFLPNAAALIHGLKEKGYRVALATNPLFPRIATESRIRWAGLTPEDFEFYTSYETSRFCKPNLNYYKQIINQLQVSPEECLMVGNDVDEDMIACALGMQVFLLTDCLINKSEADISSYRHGDFDTLSAFMQELPLRKAVQL